MKTTYIRMLLMLLFTMSFVYANEYEVDKSNSSVSFKIKCMVVGNVRGNFKEFSGHFEMQGNKLKLFDAICYTNSIATKNAKRNEDLKSKHFFHVSKYPEMKLKMLKREAKKILMSVTIKGITKEIYFNYKPSIKFVKLQKKHRAAFALSGKIKIKDFNLDLHSTVGKKSIVLGKTVHILANIEGYENLSK